MLPGEHPHTCVLSAGTQGPGAQSWAGQGTRSDEGEGGSGAHVFLFPALKHFQTFVGKK